MEYFLYTHKHTQGAGAGEGKGGGNRWGKNNSERKTENTNKADMAHTMTGHLYEDGVISLEP